MAAAALIIALTAFYLHKTSSIAQYNLILISIDTLRPDHLGFAGYSRSTSPNMDGLAAEGVVFTNAYSQSGWTLPSMVTILTGLYPRDHGATTFSSAVKKGIPSLAAVLGQRGYDSRGIVSHLLLTPEYGLDNGFDEYDYSILDDGNPHDISTSEQLTDKALESLDDMEEPFFLWVHYFDPHFKYLPHERWASFGDSDADRYDQEIAFTDQHIGRLLDFLRESNLYENSVIVLTSDHGEEFGEHGGSMHRTTYEEVVRVPLVIKAPLLEPGSRNDRTDQIDLFPTILEILGTETGSDFGGRNLFGSERKGGAVFIERDRPAWFRQRAVIVGDYKLIRIMKDTGRKTSSGKMGTIVRTENIRPGHYLFDLSGDPFETKNIFSRGHTVSEKLVALLDSHLEKVETAGEKIEIGEELRRKLRSLGYLQ